MRMSDLNRALLSNATPSQNIEQTSPPGRIANLLKQQSPLRRKIANEALTNSQYSAHTPNKNSQTNNEDVNLTASKITHV